MKRSRLVFDTGVPGGFYRMNNGDFVDPLCEDCASEIDCMYWEELSPYEDNRCSKCGVTLLA